MIKLKDQLLRSRSAILLLTVFSFGILFSESIAREISPKEDIRDNNRTVLQRSTADPIVEYVAHNRGNIQLMVANNGTFGTYGLTLVDPITGELIQSCIYPKNSNIVFLWVSSLWIGAVVGRDTLVSCGTEDWYSVNEFWPEVKPFGDFKIRSIDPISGYYDEDAKSEEDFICEYTDTVTNEGLTGSDIDPQSRPHKPLNIKVYQKSMAWSYEYADDFVLFDYQIENIGRERLKDVYMGIFVDGDTWHKAYEGPVGWNDDIVGFLPYYPAPEGYGYIDTLNIAYSADNDGDPRNGVWNDSSATSVVGVKIVRTPSDSLKYSYNWWRIEYGNPTNDFGPRQQDRPDDPFRYDFGPRLGTPVGDRNKYYILRHEEFDYDLIETAVDHTSEGFLPPPEDAERYAMGYDTRYLLSFGPFNINPGEKLPITFAWVGGENFHVDPTAFESHDPANPSVFYNKLNFEEFAANTRWASWVYDNPGVDTDEDGYRGKYRLIALDTVAVDTTINGVDTTLQLPVCINCDTVYYEGDGVPDFKGASPPPAPEFWLEPGLNKVTVRINGIRSELAVDQFSGEMDFEGYRVYLGRENLKHSYSLIASYDKLNYNKYVYNTLKYPPKYELLDNPFTLDELRCLYADSCNDTTFDPEVYSRSTPFIHPLYPDSVFFFAKNDFNVSEFGVTTTIRKKFPDIPYPSTFNVDSIDTNELTEDGYFKYFEYELEITDLLPTVGWYINVTAFDFGSPKTGIGPLESSVVNSSQMVYASYSAEEQQERDLPIYVYPNPYRIDGHYRNLGFEARNEDFLSDDRARELHFVNLPPKCKISIYSIDGDLVKEFDHDKDLTDPNYSHDQWDLITRNTQRIVSGLYYFVVEWDEGSFIGKFVIIM